jgi:hypothetical protein
MDEERRLRERLAQFNGADPNGKGWVRWCREIGVAGMRRAVAVAEQGSAIRVKPINAPDAGSAHGIAPPERPAYRAAG